MNVSISWAWSISTYNGEHDMSDDTRPDSNEPATNELDGQLALDDMTEPATSGEHDSEA